MTRIALYPGSFDPLTNGHVNIIERGLRAFDKVIVAVLTNSSKTAAFTVEDRIKMIEESFAEEPNLSTGQFEGLLVDYAREVGATVILRGLRAVADFEYEYQMANMNRRLEPAIETVFLMASPQTFYVSSRLVKEVAALGGDLTGIVPPGVKDRLDVRFPRNK